MISKLGFATGEGERQGATVGRADGLDRTELLLVLTDVVLKRSEDLLRLIGSYHYAGYHICLRNTGHELCEIEYELGRSMRDEREVCKHALRFIRSDVDFQLILFCHNYL